MTRINVGYPVELLTRQHLIAEHREIKRIPNAVAKGRVNLKDIPQKFTLGEGHVRFFYNKLLYLLNRYKEIHKECKNRGYNVQDYSSAWDNVPERLMNDWSPSEGDKKLIIERIKERLTFFTICYINLSK